MIPVEGYNGLYRDEKSQAIINADKNQYEEYIKHKNSLIKDKIRLDNLESDLKEIKLLLIKLIENK